MVILLLYTSLQPVFQKTPARPLSISGHQFNCQFVAQLLFKIKMTLLNRKRLNIKGFQKRLDFNHKNIKLKKLTFIIFSLYIIIIH